MFFYEIVAVVGFSVVIFYVFLTCIACNISDVYGGRVGDRIGDTERFVFSIVT